MFLLKLLILLSFFVTYSYSIVSQILPSVSMYEESPISTIVVDLRSIFQQLNVHSNQAALLHSQSSQPFEYNNGFIRIKSRLDREDYVRKRLCSSGNIYECNFTLTLTVNINRAPYNYILSQPIICYDINDMTPKFSQTESKIFMAENVPIGHRIPLETAIDFDSPSYGIEYYRLESIDGYQQGQFDIIYDNHSRELELIVKERLDREKIDKFLLKLLSIDRGNPPNIGTQMLIIEITDINDCQPRFESSIYNVSVAENTIPEYLIIIHAIDNDIGQNGELFYSLENDYNGLFRLDKTTGILTLNQALDYEAYRLYKLNVKVSDNGFKSLADTAVIHVYVLDQNDHPPSIQMKFNPLLEQNHDGNMAYVQESFDIRLPIAFVTVTDQDSGDNGKAELTVEPRNLFYLETIQTNQYVLKSFEIFDRESIGFYQIELHARDYGQPNLRRSMTFELNITDINDEIPQFKANYTFDLIENNRIPTIIGQINAYDRDQGENGRITYTIISPVSSSLFSITSNDGIISTNTSFDYEKRRHYKIQIRAQDHGQTQLESFTFVYINIINQNEYTPEFEKDNYEFNIYENETVHFIGQVKAYDKDFGDKVYYSLNNYEDLFFIDYDGKIYTGTIFDREIQDQYKLIIIATDNSTIGTTTVTIKIQDINDNPPIFIWPETNEIHHVLTDDHSQRIDKTNPLAHFLTDIIVKDNDIGNNSKYELTLSSKDLFFIGLNNSLWLTNSSLIPGRYQLVLQAKNKKYLTNKSLDIIIYERNPLKLNLLTNMSKTIKQFPLLFLFILIFLIICSICLIIVYYFCVRKTDIKKQYYGSRLIVNDEDKSKENSPQTKSLVNISNHTNDYSIIAKQRHNSQVPSVNSPSTTDGEFPSSFLSYPHHNNNGISSSTSDLDRSNYRRYSPTTSTLSALTTLTRKPVQRQQIKNVCFQQQEEKFLSKTNSTFSTLPKQNKCDTSLKYPQPPPLLNGINLLDKMLTKTNDITDQSNNNQWFNITSNSQTRASVV